MILEYLCLRNFRNYSCGEFEFCPSVNVVRGENAQGKTNLIEAVSFLSCGRTIHGVKDRELIKTGCAEARIEAKIDAGRDKNIMISLFADKRRATYINDVKITRAADALGVLPTVLFVPDDLRLLRDGAAARRKFADCALCQLYPRYLALLTEYNKIIEHKTRILRDFEQKPALLDALPEYNEKLAETGAELTAYRSLFVQKIASYASPAHGEISGGKETLSLGYVPGAEISDTAAGAQTICNDIKIHLQKRDQAEKAARSCLVGSHKDDICALVDGMPLKAFASQGQTRTAALSLKIAERELFYSELGKYPLLLLDDVLSELDAGRRDFVLNRIRGGQVIITGCDAGYESSLRTGRIFCIKNGSLDSSNDF